MTQQQSRPSFGEGLATLLDESTYDALMLQLGYCLAQAAVYLTVQGRAMRGEGGDEEDLVSSTFAAAGFKVHAENMVAELEKLRKEMTPQMAADFDGMKNSLAAVRALVNSSLPQVLTINKVKHQKAEKQKEEVKEG